MFKSCMINARGSRLSLFIQLAALHSLQA